MSTDWIASALKVSAPVACPVHVVFLSPRDGYKRWLLRSGHSVVAFLSVKCAAEQQGGDDKFAEIKENLCRYSSSAVAEVQSWNLVKSLQREES